MAEEGDSSQSTDRKHVSCHMTPACHTGFHPLTDLRATLLVTRTDRGPCHSTSATKAPGLSHVMSSVMDMLSAVWMGASQ